VVRRGLVSAGLRGCTGSVRESAVLPEAVRAEGMPARKLDRIGPLAQANAAALMGPVHLRQARARQTGRLAELEAAL
ncbi:hypothetical protein THAOC_31041, partial [Thalassiosira oceanica]